MHMILCICFHLFCSWRIIRDDCSTNCGTGVAKQNVTCVLTSRYKGTNMVEMSHCEKRPEIGPKPADRVVCHGKCRNTQWQYSEWTKVEVVALWNIV